MGNAVSETNSGQYRRLLFIIVEDLGHDPQKSWYEQKYKIEHFILF
jgi:hypothetical protein